MGSGPHTPPNFSGNTPLPFPPPRGALMVTENCNSLCRSWKRVRYFLLIISQCVNGCYFIFLIILSKSKMTNSYLLFALTFTDRVVVSVWHRVLTQHWRLAIFGDYFCGIPVFRTPSGPLPTPPLSGAWFAKIWSFFQVRTIMIDANYRGLTEYITSFDSVLLRGLLARYPGYQSQKPCCISSRQNSAQGRQQHR